MNTNDKSAKIKVNKRWENGKEDFFELLFCIIFLGLFALLIVSTNNNWPEIWQIILMISILICSSIAVAYPLFKKERIKIPELLIVGSCVLLLLISVIAFASVATGIYRDPIIQISASFTGGLMTLYGVGLTIKFNRLAKEKDDIKKAKPNIFLIGFQTWKSLTGTIKYEKDIEIHPELSNLKITKDTFGSYSFASIFLINSDFSMCALKGIAINNNRYIIFKYDAALLKGSANCLKLDYCFELKENINSIYIVAKDMLGNPYACYVSFEFGFDKKKKSTIIRIIGALETKPLDKNLVDIFN